MKDIIRFFKLAYLRLFTGDTPLFFKYWGSFLAALVVVATVLTQQILTAPLRIQEKYEGAIWVFNTFVMVLGALTAFLTTKNRGVGQDNFKDAIAAAKNLKNGSDQ